MSLPTSWGYTIEEEGLEFLPDMLTREEYADLTAGKYGNDRRIPPTIKAAQSAVRNYVGWHLYPALSCEFETDSLDTGHIVQLPSRYVSAVESVTVDGRELEPEEYAFKTSGLLYLKKPPARKGWNDVKVRFVSGLPEAHMDAVKELLGHRVTHAMAASHGVQSEAAGGVSVTYNANWINSARATALPDDNKEVLAAYRLQGVY